MLQLSKKCIPELQRTIISQGEKVNLSPSIVSACTQDLVNYCSGFEETKDDYGCLQVRGTQGNILFISTLIKNDREYVFLFYKDSCLALLLI